MNEKQYIRANKTIFPTLMSLYGYILLTLVIYVIAETPTAGTYIQIISTVLAMIAGIYGFVRHKQDTYCSMLLLLGATLNYGVLMIFGKTPSTYVYVVPIIICAMAFVKVKVILIGDTIAMVTFLVHTVRMQQGGLIDPETLVISILIMILSLATSVSISYIQGKTNSENIEAVTVAAKEQEKVMERLVETANHLMKQLEDAEQ